MRMMCGVTCRHHPSSEALAHRHEVRHHTTFVAEPPLSRSSHAALDLIKDQACSILVTQLARSSQVFIRGHVDTALTLDGFQDQRRDLVTSEAAGLENLREVRQVVPGHVCSVGHHSQEGRAECGLGSGGESADSFSVEAVDSGHDVLSPSVQHGHFQTRLNRLKATR